MPDSKDIQRAKTADLITFPKRVTGAVCSNCRFVNLDKQYCNHPEVDQDLFDGVSRMCCSFWDADGTKRAWESLEENQVGKTSFTEKVDKELKKRLAMTSDEYTEGSEKPKAEVFRDPNPEQEPTVPGGAPKAKTPEEIRSNPHDAVNQDAVKEMGAKTDMAFDPEKGKAWWDSVTSGKTHKIKACMDAAKSFADDPGAFCGALANEVGYKPE